MVLGCFRSAPLREHTEYLGRSNSIPLCLPTTPKRDDGLFADLRRSIPKTKAREARKNAWVLAATWRLVYERVSARQDPARDQSLIQRLGRTINASLREYRHRRTEEAGEDVERLLGADPPPSTGKLGTG